MKKPFLWEYLSCFLCLLFCVFSSYIKLEEYISLVNRKLENNSPVILNNHEIFTEIKGSEVLHQVAQMKEQTKLYKIGSTYYNHTLPAQEAEIFINGVEANQTDISDIRPEDLYSVRYEFDQTGRLRAVCYDLAQ